MPSPQKSDDRMPRLDMEKDKHLLSPTQQYYIKYMQSLNAERVIKLRKLRKSNRLLATGLGAFATFVFGCMVFHFGSRIRKVFRRL